MVRREDRMLKPNLRLTLGPISWVLECAVESLASRQTKPLFISPQWPTGLGFHGCYVSNSSIPVVARTSSANIREIRTCSVAKFLRHEPLTARKSVLRRKYDKSDDWYAGNPCKQRLVHHSCGSLVWCSHKCSNRHVLLLRFTLPCTSNDHSICDSVTKNPC